MSKGPWEVVECGVGEWFLGHREGETSGDGYNPYEEIGHGPESKELAETLAVILNAQETRILELDKRLKRVEAAAGIDRPTEAFRQSRELPKVAMRPTNEETVP